MTTDLLEVCSTEEICEAMGGNPELLADLCNRLKEWLQHQPHLPQDLPQRKLEFFILVTKHSLELAKQKLDMYYTVRLHVPELFAERDPSAPSITSLSELVQWVTLPKLTPERYRVSILRWVDDDPAKFPAWEVFKYSFMVGDVRLLECRSKGDIYVYDLSAIRLGHLAKLTPAMLKKCEIVATKAFGARIKGIHFINAPSFIDRIVSLVKSTIKPKLAARVHVHSAGIESLYEYVPKSVLPSDYGGNQTSMNELDVMVAISVAKMSLPWYVPKENVNNKNAARFRDAIRISLNYEGFDRMQLSNISSTETKWHEKLIEWRDWFLKEQSITVDESLRPGPTFNADDLFGFHGSFRKLEVD